MNGITGQFCHQHYQAPKLGSGHLSVSKTLISGSRKLESISLSESACAVGANSPRSTSRRSQGEKNNTLCKIGLSSK